MVNFKIEMDFMKILILSGGGGARLWPSSRESFPKQFMKIENGLSLLQNTVLRALSLENISEIITATNKNYFFYSVDEYKKIQLKHNSTFILEPFPRNTAAPIAIASLYCSNFGDEELLILPSDHVVGNNHELIKKINLAMEAVNSGKIVMFGIKPTEPHLGYGYIKTGKKLFEGIYEVDGFIEKPILSDAEKYLHDNEFYWNSGMLIAKPSKIIDEFKRQSPEYFKLIQEMWSNTVENYLFHHKIYSIPEEHFEDIKNSSIDYEIMEKSSNCAVVPVDCGWSDVGSWNEFANLFKKEVWGSQSNSEVIQIDSRNFFVKTEGKLVAAIGVNDIVLIDTPDALLIADKTRAQEVKVLVEQMKLKGHNSYKQHLCVERPWGRYIILEESPDYKIKKIIVDPSATLSLQYHLYRSEHWVVVSGVALIQNGDNTMLLGASESTFIPKKVTHRLSNFSEIEPLIIIEVQAGDYLGEDDIVRLDDAYSQNK